MEFVSFRGILPAVWDAFVNEHPFGWFWHTTTWMKYSLVSQFNMSIQNHSFGVIENNCLIAIVPLLIEEKIGPDSCDFEIVYGGWATPIPLISLNTNSEKQHKILRNVFSHIDEIAASNNVTRSLFRFYDTYLSYRKNLLPCNVFLKYEYLDASLSTQIIHLDNDTENILRNCSKGCKADINRAQKHLVLMVYESENISHDVFEQFINFYFHIAGKITRPPEAFELLYEMIIENQALLLFAFQEDQLVGAQYTVIYKEGSYYLMSAVSCNFQKCSIGHFLQWNAMKALRDRGIKYYEIGWQQYGDTLFDFPSEKEKRIAFFKRSFGGTTVTQFSGEKFYSKKKFKITMQDRMQRYIENNFS